MLKPVALCVFCTLLLSNGSVSAEEHCDSYSVIPGDTLRLISERYYGTRDLSPIIYDANAGLIGSNPNAIEVGMELTIPCREGIAIPQETASVKAVEFAVNPEPSNVTGFLAVSGTTPFINSDSSGLLPKILATALRSGGFEGQLTISRPNSMSETLGLAANSSAQLTFPVIQPACDSPSLLSDRSKAICENFTISAPFFPITLGIFTAEGGHLASADTAKAFVGKTICIADFHNDDILRELGIIDMGIQIAALPAVQDCLAGVRSSEFDATVADYNSIEALDQPNIVDIPAFAKQSALHAIAHSKNPAAQATLGIFNTGLQKILETGEWFAIVNAHMSQDPR